MNCDHKAKALLLAVNIVFFVDFLIDSLHTVLSVIKGVVYGTKSCCLNSHTHLHLHHNLPPGYLNVTVEVSSEILRSVSNYRQIILLSDRR